MHSFLRNLKEAIIIIVSYYLEFGRDIDPSLDLWKLLKGEGTLVAFLIVELV